MKIALISDIHDHDDALAWALDEVAKTDATQLICLGDMGSPRVVAILARTKIPVYAVLGNNDGDRIRMALIAQKPDSTLKLAASEWGEITLEGKTYFCTHYPELAENAALSGKYAAVFHGHTHQQRHEVVGGTPVVNPGKITRYPHDVPVSFALFDTNTQEAAFIEQKTT